MMEFLRYICAVFIYFSSIHIKYTSQMPILDLESGENPKDLLADTLIKAAIILNNPNRPFGNLGKEIGNVAVKEIFKIEKELKPSILSEKLENSSENGSESESGRSSRQAPPPFPQIETAIKLLGLAINLGTTLLPGAILNVTSTANQQFAPPMVVG